VPLMGNTKHGINLTGEESDNRNRHQPINGGEAGGCWGRWGRCVRKLFQAPLGCCCVRTLQGLKQGQGGGKKR